MHTPLRILIVHNAYKIPGGEDSVVENEVRMLQRAGIHVVTYFRSNTELDSYSLPQKLLLPFRSVYSARTYRDIRRLIRCESIDLVHVHNTLSVISPSVYYAALSCRVPVLQTVHNYRLLCPGAMLLRDGHICTDCISKGLKESVRHGCYRNSKIQTLISTVILKYHRMRHIYHRISYLCLTDFNKQILLQLNQKKEIINPDRVYVKPNFTAAPDHLIPYETRSKRILYASRMETAKGIDLLLDAWKQYEQKLSDSGMSTAPVTELTLCGCGPEEERVKQKIEESRLKHIRFVGQLPHKELLKLMADSLAVCMPTQWYEGFPVTIAESYACGTPVIGSDLGNVGNLILHGTTGYTFPPGDCASLARLFWHWDQDSASTLSRNARQLYEERYTEEINLKQLLSVYEKVLQS